MPKRTLELTDHFNTFIDGSIAEGEFHDAEDVVQSALAMLEEERGREKAHTAWLLREAQEGLDDLEAGRYQTFSSAKALTEYIDSIAEEAYADSGRRAA